MSTSLHRLTTIAFVAALAAATAAPAWADDPPPDGPTPAPVPPPATANTAAPNGAFDANEDGDPPEPWMFASCGNGCAAVTFPDGQTREADLENGQWRLDDVNNANAVKCASDGTEHPGSAHYSWDANTLIGQVWATDDTGACGSVPGDDTTPVPFNLTPAQQ